ncbi:MAG: tRNA uridine-5-carboxymethylaminomethyl(34) synthesis GTPase MnmE [Gammaproteobacteria bacterium]
MKHQPETIAAIATPSGRGGIGVVRVSGPAVCEIARRLLGSVPAPRVAEYRSFLSEHGDTLDVGIALYFESPHSFTGEDVLELQGHGGPVIMDLLLRRIIDCGARLARPGEFSERAFINDKLDLTQAEAIADLIDSATTQAAKSAIRSLQGEFSSRVRELDEKIINLRLYIESAIDFPEEEVDFLTEGKVGEQLDRIISNHNHLISAARQGSLLREGMHVVIAGKPNAGKSSLLNALARRESAIVTHIPGTTRDVLREHISIDGLPLYIVDTAGLRDSDDPVEKIGIQRAHDEIAVANRVLLVIDDSEPKETVDALLNLLPKDIAVTIIRNKADISGNRVAISDSGFGPQISLSAKTGEGIDLLCSHLKSIAGLGDTGEGLFTARRRHIDALNRAGQYLEDGKLQLIQSNAGDLLAEDLRQAHGALTEITGEFTSEDLLGKIFETFCIGK